MNYYYDYFLFERETTQSIIFSSVFLHVMRIKTKYPLHSDAVRSIDFVHYFYCYSR